MYAPDQDISEVPFWILIRARTEDQFNQAVLVVSSHIAATKLSARTSEHIAPMIKKAMANVTLRESKGDRAPSASNVVTVLQALADLDDWCGTRPPRWWPWPIPRPFPWPDPSPEPRPIKPDPSPWREFGYSDIAALKTITTLATMVNSEVGQELANVSQAMVKELAG